MAKKLSDFGPPLSSYPPEVQEAERRRSVEHWHGFLREMQELRASPENQAIDRLQEILDAALVDPVIAKSENTRDLVAYLADVIRHRWGRLFKGHDLFDEIEDEGVRKNARRGAEEKHASRRKVLEAAWTSFKRGNYSTLEEGARAYANHYKNFEPERDEEKRIRTFRDYFARRSKEEGIPIRRGRPVKRTKTTSTRSP